MKKQFSDKIYTSVVIVAAGKGTRMNIDTNKQFIILDDMPLLAHTIAAFQKNNTVNEIVLVVNNEHLDFVN
jgi:2-C-methyl-D-erythritol 4-phosphate cytidylyltransferase